MPEKYKSEELRKLIVEAMQALFDEFQQDNDPKHVSKLMKRWFRHPRVNIPVLKPGPQSDRVPVGDFEAPRRMEPNTRGYSQRPCGVDAPKNESRYQGKGIPH
uniref:Uncharacterized protein n=1 Tax=Acrobeloides nanus TaxID=290746 RepID=A0A914DBT2_9BILA